VDRAELKQYQNREDKHVYEPIMLEVLSLFGLAVHTSLERTLGKYLKATDGVFRNDLRSDWELSKVSKLLCTNNAAERPFGIAKGTRLTIRNPLPTCVSDFTILSYPSIHEHIPEYELTHTSYFQFGHVYGVSSPS
jgi:hypothetical protein